MVPFSREAAPTDDLKQSLALAFQARSDSGY
jgi:hypothetical protein